MDNTNSKSVQKRLDIQKQLDVYNHPYFRLANKYTHRAEKLLQGMGLTLEQAREWIQTWASGAGDGAQ